MNQDNLAILLQLDFVSITDFYMLKKRAAFAVATVKNRKFHEPELNVA